jgi:hypothetical protein
MAIEKFLRMHPATYDPREGLQKQSVLMVKMPTTPDERRFYVKLLSTVIAVGTEDALHAVQTDAQVASRFDPLHLARWSESDAFRNFIVTFGK